MSARRTFLEDKLASIVGDMDKARQKGHSAAVVSFHKLHLEVASDLWALDAVSDIQQSGDTRLMLLQEVTNLQKQAEAKGSMVAASKLLQQRQAILAEIEEERRQQVERERQASDDGAFMARFLAAFDRMPRPLQRRLAEQIAQRAA